MTSTENFVLVTGATNGIGLEMGKLFARDGHNLILVARSEDELRDVGHELQQNEGVQVIQIACDLAETLAAYKLYEEVTSQGLQVDILVYTGGRDYEEITRTGIQQELDVLQVNVNSMLILTRLFLKDMMDRNTGRILHAIHQEINLPPGLHSVCFSAKAFAHSFTEGIRHELKNTGVTVTSLVPPTADNGVFKNSAAENFTGVPPGIDIAVARAAKKGYESLMKGDKEQAPIEKNDAALVGSVISNGLHGNVHNHQIL